MIETNINPELRRPAPVPEINRREALLTQLQCGIDAVATARRMYERGTASVAEAVKELDALESPVLSDSVEVIEVPLF